MEMKWYIDSWSPVEGVVFASNRVCSDDPWDIERVQTIMMAAPDFEPQNVSRAMAFGAAQRGFQEQFSLQGAQESGFDTLELLSLFVRRTYSGSGSGPEGNDGDAPEPPQGDDGGNEPRGDWQRLKEFEGASKVKSLLSEIQPLSFDQRKAKLFDLVWQRDEADLKYARDILDGSAYAIDAPRPSHELYRLRAIARLLFVHEDEHRWYPLHEGGNALSLALRTPLPKNYAHAVGLPLKVKTMMDALNFLAADRRFLNQCAVASLLPLLLAVAANFCSNRAAASWQPYRPSYRKLFVQECCGFIARWLPFDELPESLANIVSDWSKLNTAAQRGV